MATKISGKTPGAPDPMEAVYAQLLRAQIDTDPLSPVYPHYKPSPTQRAYHASNAYYRLVRGGGRAGKTTACLVDLAWTLRGIHPHKPWRGPFIALAMAISRRQSTMVLQKKLLEECQFPGDDGHPNIGRHPLIPMNEIADITHIKHAFRSVYSVKMKNGCELWFAWSDDETSWKKIQGVKLGRAYIDENAGNKKLVLEVRKRLADSQKSTTWHGVMDWAGHGTDDNEAFSEFSELCELPAKDHQAFHLLPGETGAVTPEATQRLRNIMTPEEQAIHIDATSDSGDLVRIYGKQWNDDRHIHQTDRIIDPTDNLWVGYDPGVDHPMGMLVCACSKETPRALHAVKAITRKGGTIDDDVAWLSRWLDGRTVAGFVYDTNLKNRDRGGGPSLLDQMKTKFEKAGVVIKAWWQSKKNHLPGITAVRTMLAEDRFSTNTSPESGCKTLVAQMKRYRGKESTRFTGDGGIIKKDDELVDALRYTVMSFVPWSSQWVCGRPASLVVQDLDSDLTPEQRLHERQMELSAIAAKLRGGRSRYNAFTRNGYGTVPLWQRFRHENPQTVQKYFPDT